ncbi:MAG: ribose-5-phosphate isomerase RpiA [Ruminiclostridium sp.]
MSIKKRAGEKAVEFIKDGMVVGLGTGSTVYFSILKLAERIKEGLDIKAVSTSNSTTQLSLKLGIPLIPFNEVDYIDITIDGADEVDGLLNGIKGGGGALLYEKLVATSSKKVIWVVDESKIVDSLGKFPLPVEVVPFAYLQVFRKLRDLDFNPVIRKYKNSYFITDGQHYIMDLYMQKIEKPFELERTLKLISGIVDTGLFINIVDTIIIGSEEKVEIINR